MSRGYTLRHSKKLGITKWRKQRDRPLPLSDLLTDNIRHPGYGKIYHTGECCIEPECIKPAGTFWSQHLCAECDIIRKDRIAESLEWMLKEMRGRL